MIHFGDEEWDGPLSLHEMMSTRDMEILSFVENYRIHLIDPAKLSTDELEKFSTSLKEVMGYIKYSKNKDKLLGFLQNNSHKTIEPNAARVIKMVTNSPIRMQGEKEEIEMCKAIDDLMLEGEARGIIEVCYDLCFSEEDILKKLQSKLNIPLQEASEYLRQYDPKEGRILGRTEWKNDKLSAGSTT